MQVIELNENGELVSDITNESRSGTESDSECVKLNVFQNWRGMMYVIMIMKPNLKIGS